MSARRAQRAMTIGSVLKSVITIILIAVFGTMMLSEIGVNIAPIIASAGIIGIALGFGAQSLVRDFLSGIFMIFEDQYGVGDVVDVGEATGTIEAVTLRVTRLRDLNGTVWYVPERRDPPGRQHEPELVARGRRRQRRVRRGPGPGEAGARARWPTTSGRTRTSATLIIEEPEITGVEMFAADSVNLRVLIKTRPMEQWAVAREMRQRIKSRFDHEGIEIPFAAAGGLAPRAASHPREETPRDGPGE